MIKIQTFKIWFLEKKTLQLYIFEKEKICYAFLMKYSTHGIFNPKFIHTIHQKNKNFGDSAFNLLYSAALIYIQLIALYIWLISTNLFFNFQLLGTYSAPAELSGVMFESKLAQSDSCS